MREQAGERDQKNDCQDDPCRALPRPERVLEPHVLQDRIIATIALAHENGRAALQCIKNAVLLVSVPAWSARDCSALPQPWLARDELGAYRSLRLDLEEG